MRGGADWRSVDLFGSIHESLPDPDSPGGVNEVTDYRLTLPDRETPLMLEQVLERQVDFFKIDQREVDFLT